MSILFSKKNKKNYIFYLQTINRIIKPFVEL
nr:MAG TPA: hypothetical protein [Caudoviricetes sp.]